MRYERFPGAVQFAAHRIRGLSGQHGDFVITQFLICHQQQQQAVFVGNIIQRRLDAVAEFLDFQNAQRRIRVGGCVVPDGFVHAADEVAAVPALPKIDAVIDGDAIKPCPRRVLPRKSLHFL